MLEPDIAALMELCERDREVARRFLGEGQYAKSVSESYYAVFYAAKAVLFHLGVKSKSHHSVQAGIDRVVQQGDLPAHLGHVPQELHRRRDEAVYRYARRDWTKDEAEASLRLADGFIDVVIDILARP